MIGDVSWSLMSIFENKTRCSNGFFIAAFDDAKFVGISGCDCTNVVFDDSVQFGIRLWIHPDHRTKRVPSALISPSLEWARQKRTKAWTSFNDSRAGMLRLIKVRALDDDPAVAQLWSDFRNLPEPVEVYNTRQWIAFKDFRDADFNVTS